MGEQIKTALIQMMVEDDIEKNLKNAKRLIEQAAANDAKIIVLPEMWNCPYRPSKFNEYSAYQLKSINMLGTLSRKNNLLIIGGSIPEKSLDIIYNTSYILQDGDIISRHRKMHLYDVNIPGKIKINESKNINAGNHITAVDTKFGMIGVAICYDIRFPEYFRVLEQKGVKAVFIPGAFNEHTGEKHLKLMVRARANDYQMYVGFASPAFNPQEPYKIYGHTMASDPYGMMLGELDKSEDILYYDIDPEYTDKIRAEMPIMEHLRDDVYQIRLKREDNNEQP